MFDSLRSISDHQILAHTDAIIVQDRKVTLLLLLHLHEIERRKLYLRRGYSSMFDYCTKHLKLSGPAAARRLRTARCLARYPQLYRLLESGDVNVSTVSMVAKHLKPGSAEEILARITGRSRREVERIIAELEPRTVLPPDRVRTVVVPVSVAAVPRVTVAGDSEKSPTLSPTIDDDRCAGDLQKSRGATAASAATVKLERHAVVQFTAREEVMSKLERVRALASHRLRGTTSMEQVIELLADYFIAREDPAARHERREQRSRKPATGASSRSIPARVRDQVFVRDKQQCRYVSPNGMRCNSTHVLQIDHVQPVARGGANTIDNLRLLCAYHNRLEAERLMGRCGPQDKTRG